MEHANADVMSWLPLSHVQTDIPVLGERILLMEMLNSLPITADQIKSWTDHDPVLSKVRRLILRGWQDSDDLNLKPYQQCQLELNLQNGCVLWGSHVIVPLAGRNKKMNELHEGHPGVFRMKSLARSFVWWPRMDQNMEKRIRNCNLYQYSRHLPASAPLQPWEWPQCPWVDNMLITQGHLQVECS